MNFTLTVTHTVDDALFAVAAAVAVGLAGNALAILAAAFRRTD